MEKIYKNGNDILFFDSDDEFYEFCVKPILIPRQINSSKPNMPKYYVDFDFTDEYKDAIKEGIRFVIKDENSQILKHGKVSYRTITKKVDNLDPFFGTKNYI